MNWPLDCGAGGQHVVRAGLDGFHHPEEIRYRQGRDCPTGYYEDSFDYDSVHQYLLNPLGPGGTRDYRAARFDYRNGTEQEHLPTKAPDDAILIFEGVMLFRPELDHAWDYRVLVHITFEEALSRAVVRDREHFGSEAEVRRKHATRFGPGQQQYLDRHQPHSKADVVVDNTKPDLPALCFRAS